jgi:hypothetical protein
MKTDVFLVLCFVLVLHEKYRPADHCDLQSLLDSTNGREGMIQALRRRCLACTRVYGYSAKANLVLTYGTTPCFSRI